MNTMMTRIAEAVRKAIDEAPYVVKPLGWNTSAVSFTWGVLDNVITLAVFTDPEAAEAAMDKLNDAWIARKVVESMRELDQETYENFKCDKLWKEQNSIGVWQGWIDAILKE